MMTKSIFLPICAALIGTPLCAQTPADLILHNGKIFTADDMLSVHRAIVVKDGRIVAVGGDELARRYGAPHVIDLRGRLVVPGFNDSHTHQRGRPRRYVDMSGTRSISEFQERLRQKAAELGPGEWITGWGWSEDEFAEKRRPLRRDLDEAVPGNPAVIARAGGHSAVASSLAMELAGVTGETPNPEAGIIEKDEDGEPNGIFRENWRMIARLIPEPSEDEIWESLVENLRALFAMGITSFTNASTSPRAYDGWRKIYRAHRGDLPRAALQIHFAVGFGEGEDVAARLRSLDLEFGDGDEHLRVGAIKLFVDGGYTGPAAWTLEHYRDQPDYYGKPRMSEHDFYLVVKAAHETGGQLGLHTIGDAAIKMAVDQLVRILEESPKSDHRHYLNHFTVMPPTETLRQMAEHNILIAQQPNFTYTLEGRYAANLVGERLQTNNPLRTPMSYGIFMALGADIIPTGPLLGLYAAVTAIVGYTRNSAYITFEEDIKGTLEPGKLADFVVLSDDLLTIEPDRILDVQVDLTVLGGKVVYER
jgi:predicted amidohydrolase YtcJ